MRRLFLAAILAAATAVCAQAQGQGNQVIPAGGSGSGIPYGTGTGPAQAQAVTTTPNITTLTTGTFVTWLPAAANTAAAPTLAAGTTAATAITKCGTVALIPGDLLSTVWAVAQYDGTEWVLQNPVQFGCSEGGLPTTGGTANAPTLTVAPAITAYSAGMVFNFTNGAANTGATTIAISGLAAKNVTKCGTTALVANDLTTTSIAVILYDGTEFQLLNPQATGCGAGGGGTNYCGAGIIDTTVACASDDFISDFTGTGSSIGQLGWGASGSGCTTGNYLQGGLPHPGQYKCATSTSSGNVAELDMNQQNQAFGAMNTVTNWEFRWIVQLSTVATVAYRFGLSLTPNGDPATNGIWIRFDTGAGDTTWTYETRSASTSTTSITNAQTPTAGTDWWTIRIRSTSAGTILFSTAKNGGAFTTETSIATNVPSATLTPFMEVVTRTTSAANYTVDWFSYLITGLAR